MLIAFCDNMLVIVSQLIIEIQFIESFFKVRHDKAAKEGKKNVKSRGKLTKSYVFFLLTQYMSGLKKNWDDST
jgi:hypothetical protein